MKKITSLQLVKYKSNKDLPTKNNKDYRVFVYYFEIMSVLI
jgi:hypothetical protein